MPYGHLPLNPGPPQACQVLFYVLIVLGTIKQFWKQYILDILYYNHIGWLTIHNYCHNHNQWTVSAPHPPSLLTKADFRRTYTAVAYVSAEGTTTITSTLDPSSTPYTSTISATGYSSGTVIYGSPASAPGTVSTTYYVATNSAGTTSTVAAHGTTSGTYAVYTQSAGYATITSYSSMNPSATPSTITTLVTASGGQSGTVEYIYPSSST